MDELYYDWDPEKNRILKETRGVTFEMCVATILEGHILDKIINKVPREHQVLYVLSINNYTYVVPTVKIDTGLFLKTIYPSSKYHKIYAKK